MDEFVHLAVAHLGLPEGRALSATRSVIAALSAKMSNREFAELATVVPGAAAVVEQAHPSAGLAAPLRKFLGHISGASNEQGLTEAVPDLSSSGIGADQIVPFVQLFLSYIELKGGDEVRERVLAAVPELAAYGRNDN